MMKRTAILIDDDQMVHNDARYRLKAVPGLILVATFFSTDEALTYVDSCGGVDVVFSDILMPGKDGYEANRLLAGYCGLFVFLTQKEVHGPEIFATASMVHYMRKPIDAAAVSLLLEQLDRQDRDTADRDIRADALFLYDRHSKNRVLVKFRDILMIKFQQKYGTVTLADEKKNFLVYGSVAATVRQLRTLDWFIRINQSTIISIHAVKYVDPQLVVYFTWGGHEAVTRTYQSVFRAFMKRNGLG